MAAAINISFTDLFWIFIVVSSLQPLFRQRLLDASRRRLIAEIERKRGSRVILLAHRQETMSFLGFPIVRYINIDDAEEILHVLRLTDAGVPIDLILHAGRSGPADDSDRARHQPAQGQGHRHRSALRHVRRNAHCPRR